VAALVRRGAVTPVLILRRRPAARRLRLTAKETPSVCPGEAKSPGELVQIDTLFVNLRPDKPIKSPPTIPWPNGPSAASPAKAAASATALLHKLIA
jgi:putative transposase